MEALFDALPFPALFTGLDQTVRRVNQAFLEAFGTSAEHVIGNSARSLYPTEEDFRLAEQHWQDLSHDNPQVAFEAPLRRHSGELFRAAVTSRLVVRGDGAPAGYVGVIRDIEKDHRAREQLALATVQLEQETRRKDEFLAVLSHELRNPLASISPALALLGSTRLEDAQSRYVRAIERQTKKLRRMVDDILDFSRISRGKTRLERQPVELASVLQLSVETLQPSIEQKRQALLVQLAPDLWVNADPLRLEQVFTNILHNASKYTDEGGRIRVRATGDTQSIWVSISDTGLGISPSAMPRIFQPFAQIDASLDRAQGGLGIGLALVRNLVSLHGGTVHASSEGLGKGSTFEVTLPRHQTPLRTDPPNVQASSEELGGFSVLVVDDNRDAADLQAELLSGWGLSVTTSYTSKGALALVERGRCFDLAILDIGLPELDGYELARRLQRLAPATPLVALTGYGAPGDIVRSREVGFQRHLVKPIEMAQLRAVLDELLVVQPRVRSAG